MFYKIAKVLCTIYMRTVYRIKITGSENIPKDGGVILCCNHRFFRDPIYIGIAIKRHITFLAKEELFNVPVLKPILNLAKVISLDRGGGDLSAIRACVSALKDKKLLLVFPQGKRERGGVTLGARPGVALMAKQSGSVMVPVGLTVNGKIPFFTKVYIRFGLPVKYEDLAGNMGAHTEYARVSSILMDRINELRL